MKRDELRAYQVQRLNLLIHRIMGKNKFYTSRIREAGIENGVKDLDEFVQKMPLTTKKELIEDQAQSPPYGTFHTYPVEQYCRFHQTSGTTTQPLRWLDTREDWNWVVQNWQNVFEAARVTGCSRVFFAFSFGPFLGFWSAMDAARAIGCLTIAGGGMSSEARLQTLLENQADVLCCTPTYALHLAQRAHALDLPLEHMNIKKIIVAGEPGGCIESVRSRIESAWGNGCRLFDHHGMTEVGPVSYECVEVPRVLHVIESSFIAEVLHPHSREPVAEGERGELVLTTLGRDGSPLFRYRTGDIVQPSWKGKAEFARDELALVDGLLGRIDDMLVVRGVNIYPSMVDSLIHSIDDIIEYRVHVNTKQSLVEMSVEIELPSQADTHKVMAGLEAAFKHTLHLRIPVKVVPEQSLPRFEMKAKRWVIN